MAEDNNGNNNNNHIKELQVVAGSVRNLMAQWGGGGGQQRSEGGGGSLNSSKHKRSNNDGNIIGGDDDDDGVGVVDEKRRKTLLSSSRKQPSGRTTMTTGQQQQQAVSAAPAAPPSSQTSASENKIDNDEEYLNTSYSSIKSNELPTSGTVRESLKLWGGMEQREIAKVHHGGSRNNQDYDEDVTSKGSTQRKRIASDSEQNNEEEGGDGGGGSTSGGSVNDRWKHLLERQQRISSSNIINDDEGAEAHNSEDANNIIDTMMNASSSSIKSHELPTAGTVRESMKRWTHQTAPDGGVGTTATGVSETTSTTKVVKTDEVPFKSNRSGTVNSSSNKNNNDTTEEGTTTTNTKRQRIVKEDNSTTPKKYPSIKSNELPTTGTVKDSMKRWGGTTTSSSSSSAVAAHKKIDVVAASNDNGPASTSSRGSSFVKQQQKQLPQQQKTEQDENIVDGNNNNDDINVDKEMEYLSTNYPSVKSNELPTSGTVRQSLQIWKTTTKPKNDDDYDDDDNSSKRRRKTKVATKTEDRTSTGTVISSRSGSRRRDDDQSNKSTSPSSRIRQEQQTIQQQQQQNRPPKPSSSVASSSPASKRKPVKMNEIEKEVTGGISLENRLQQWSNATNNAASAKASRSKTPLSPTQLGQKERTTAVATKSPQRPPLPFPTKSRSAAGAGAGAGPATTTKDNSFDHSLHSLHDSISALTDDGTYADLTATSIAAQSVPTTIIENSTTTTVDYDTFIKMSVRDRLKAWSDQTKLRRKVLYSSRAMSPRDRKREIEGWMGTPQYTETIEKTNAIPTATHLLQYDNASPADRRKLLETYELPLQSDDPIIQKDIIEFCTDFRSTFHQESNVIERNQILELYPDTVAIYYRGMVPNKLSEHEFWERFYYRCVVRTEKQRTVTQQTETTMIEQHEEEQQQHEQSITPKHANTADSTTGTAKSSRVSPISSLAKSRASVKAKLKNWQDLTAQVMERHRSSTAAAAAATAARIELEETRQQMKDNPKLNYETAVTSNVGTNELNKEPVVIPQGLSVADRIVDYDDSNDGNEKNQPLYTSASPNQEIPTEEQSASILQVSTASIGAKHGDADTNAGEEDTSQTNSREPVLSSIAAKRNDYWRNVSSQNQYSDNTDPRIELEETRKQLSADRQRSKNDNIALESIEVNDGQVDRNLPSIARVVKTSVDDNDVAKRDMTTSKVGPEAQTYEDDTLIKESSAVLVAAKRLNWQNQFAADSNKDEYQNTEARMELEKTRKQIEQRKSIVQESFLAAAAETQTDDIDAPKEEYQEEARAGLVAAKRLHWQKQTSSDANENDYRNSQAKMELKEARKQLEERKSTSHEPIPEISAGILDEDHEQDTMVSSHRAEGNNELATMTNSKISFDSSDDDEEMIEQTQASEEVHHGKEEYEHTVENQIEIKKDDVSNSILFDKPLESVPSPIHAETPKDEEIKTGSDDKNIDDGSYSSSPEVPEEMNELGAVTDHVQAKESEVTGEAHDELKTDSSKTSVDVHGVDNQSFYHASAEDAEEMYALPVEDINESGTMAPEVTGEAHEERKIESSKFSSVEVQEEDDQSSHPSSPEVLDKMDALPVGETASIRAEESESNAESQDASMSKSIEAAAEVKSSIEATASIEEQSDIEDFPREVHDSSRVDVEERGEESSHADNDRPVPESNDDQDGPSSEVENEDEKLLEADATIVDEVGDDQILQSTSGPRKSPGEDAEVDRKEVLSEMDGEVSSLSSYEVDELDELFQMRADGEPYDETRLYELNQIVKYKSAHEEFNQDELAEFKTVAQKRRKQRKYRKEFEAILEKQDDGLEVDEDRLYCLELYAKEMVGEELSNSERLDLDEFLADEEPGEHKKEVKKSKATGRAAGSPEEAARARALALLARADGDERAETESVGSSSDTSHSGIQSGSSASDDVDHEIEEKGSMGDSGAGDENDGAVEDATSLPSDGPDDEGKSISDHKDTQESVVKDLVDDDVSEDAPLGTEKSEKTKGFSESKETVGKDFAAADANDELETSSTSEVPEVVHPADENVEGLAFKTTDLGDSLAEERGTIEDSALQDKLDYHGVIENVVQEGDAVASGTEEKVENSTGDSSIPDSVDESLGNVAAPLAKEEVDQSVDEDEEGDGEHLVEEESVGDAKVSVIEKEVDQPADERSSDGMDARPVDESMGDSRASLAAQEIDQLVDDSNSSSDTQSVKESVGDANDSLVQEDVDQSENGEEESHDGHPLEESVDDAKDSITEKVVDQPVDQSSSPVDESMGDSRTPLSSQEVNQSVDYSSSHTQSMHESVGDVNAPLAKEEVDQSMEEDEESNDGHSVEASVGDSRTPLSSQEVNQSVDDSSSHTQSMHESVGDVNAPLAKEEVDQSVEEDEESNDGHSVEASVGDSRTSSTAQEVNQSVDDSSSHTQSMHESVGDLNASLAKEEIDQSMEEDEESNDGHSVEALVGDSRTSSTAQEVNQSVDDSSSHTQSIQESVGDLNASLAKEEIDQSVEEGSSDTRNMDSVDQSVGDTKVPLTEKDDQSADEGSGDGSDTHSVVQSMADIARPSTEEDVDESEDVGSVASSDAHSVNESVGDVAAPSANEEADQSVDEESNEGCSVDDVVDDAKASLIENEVDQSLNKTSPDGSDAHSIDDESVGNVDGPLKETEVDESVGGERSDTHSIDERGSDASDTHSVAAPMDEVDESMDERSTGAHSKVSRPDDDLAEGYSSEELLDAAREKGFEISVRTGNKIATAEEVRVFAEEEIQEARQKALDELDHEKREEELSRVNAYEAAVKKAMEEKDRLFDEAERKALEKAEKERLAEGASRNNLDDEKIVVSDEEGGSRSEKPSSDEESSHESENDDESVDRHLPEDLEQDVAEKSHGMVQDGAEASEHETFDSSDEENEDANETNPEERADDAFPLEMEPEMSLEDDQSTNSIDQQDEAVKLKSPGDQDERSEGGDMKHDLNSDHSEAANSNGEKMIDKAGRDDDSSSEKEISPVSAGAGEPDEVPSDDAAEDDSESGKSSSEKVGSHSDMDLEDDQSKGDLDQQQETAIPSAPSSDSEHDVGGADPVADADDDVSDVSHGVESHEPGDMPHADPTGGHSDSSFSSDSKKESVDASVAALENSSTKSHDIENDEAKVVETSSHKSSPDDEDMENGASSSSGSKWDPPSPPNSPSSEEDDANASPWTRSPNVQPKSIEMPDTEPILMDSNSQIQSHTMDDFAEADNVDDYCIPEDNSEIYETESVQQDEPSRGSPAQSSVSSDDGEESSVDEDKESTKEDAVHDSDSENAEVGSVQSTSEAQESTTSSGSDRENEEKGSVADEKETVKEVVINEGEDDDASLGSVQSSEDSNEPDLEQENDTASKSSTSRSSSGHSNDLDEPAENHGIKEDDASDGSVQSAAESESQVNEELSQVSIGGKSDELRANEDQESANSEQSHSTGQLVETIQASEDEESAVDQDDVQVGDASQHEEGEEDEESIGSGRDSVQSPAGSDSQAGQSDGLADEDNESVVDQDDVQVDDASQHEKEDEESIGSGRDSVQSPAGSDSQSGQSDDLADEDEESVVDQDDVQVDDASQHEEADEESTGSGKDSVQSPARSDNQAEEMTQGSDGGQEMSQGSNGGPNDDQINKEKESMVDEEQSDDLADEDQESVVDQDDVQVGDASQHEEDEESVGSGRDSVQSSARSDSQVEEAPQGSVGGPNDDFADEDEESAVDQDDVQVGDASQHKEKEGGESVGSDRDSVHSPVGSVGEETSHKSDLGQSVAFDDEDLESANSEQSHSRSVDEDKESAVEQDDLQVSDASRHEEDEEESIGRGRDSVQSSAGSSSETTSHGSDSGESVALAGEDDEYTNSEQSHQRGQADEDKDSVVDQDDVQVGDVSQHEEDGEDEESVGSGAASNDDVDSVKSAEVSFKEEAEKRSASESTGNELENEEEGSSIDNEMSIKEDAGNAGDTAYLDRGSVQSSEESFFEGESTSSSGGELEGEEERSSVDQADVVKPDISDAENSNDGSVQSSEDMHESSSASSADDGEDEEKAASPDEKEINKEDTVEEGSVQSSENSFADVGTSSVASNEQGGDMAVSTDHETHSESEGSGADRSAAKKDSEHQSSHPDHSSDEGSDQESRSGGVNLFERAHPLPSPSTSSAENSKDSDGGASVSSEAKEVPQSSHDDVQKQEDFHMVAPSIEPTMSDEANDYPVLPEFWTEAVDEENGKKYYFNSLTQEVSWEVPSSNTGPEQPSAIEEETASDEREDSQNDNAVDKDVATGPEQPSAIEEETASDEREDSQNDNAVDKGIAMDDVELPNDPNDEVLSKEESPDATKRLALPSNLDEWETGSDSSASAETNEINNIQETKKKGSEKPTASGDYDWSTSSESSFEELVRIPNNKTKVAKKNPDTEVVDATKALKSPVKKKKENDTLESKSPVKSLPETPKKKKITKKKPGTLSVETGTGTPSSPGKHLPDQESNIASEDSPGDEGTSETIDTAVEGEAVAITAPETLKSPKKKKKIANKKAGKASADVAASLSPGKKSPDNEVNVGEASPGVDEGESAVIDVGSVASSQGDAKDGKGGKGPSPSVESHASSDDDWNKIDAGEAMPSEQDVETPSNTVSGEPNEKNKGNRPIPFLAASSKDASKNSERERVDSQTRQSSQDDEGPEQIAGGGPSDDLADVDDSFLLSPGKSPRKKRSPLKALSLMMKGKKKTFNEIDNGRPDSDGLTPAKNSDMIDLQKGADTYDDEEDAVNFDWSREPPSKPKANTNLFKKFAGLMRRKKKKEGVDDAVDDDAMKQDADTEVVDMGNKSDVGSVEASEDSSDSDSPAETNEFDNLHEKKKAKGDVEKKSETDDEMAWSTSSDEAGNKKKKIGKKKTVSDPSEVEVKTSKKKKGTADETLKTPKKKSKSEKKPKSKKKLALLDSDDEQDTVRKKKTKKAKSKKLDLSDSDDDDSDAAGKRMSKSKSKSSKAKKISKHKDINDAELSVSWERKKKKTIIDDESDAAGKRKSSKSKSKSSNSKKQSRKKDINDPDLSVIWERKKEKKTTKSKKDSKSEPKKPKSKKLIVSDSDDESDTARKKKSSKSKSSSKDSKKKYADEEGDELVKKPKSSKKIKGKTLSSEASFSDTIKSPKKPKSSKKFKDDSSALDKLKSPKTPKKAKSKKGSKDKGINEPDLSVTWERKKQSKSERKSAAAKEGDAVKKPKSSKGLSVEPKTPKKPKSSKKAISELKSPRKIQLDP